MSSMTERWKEGRNVGRSRRALSVIDLALSVQHPNSLSLPGIVHLTSLLAAELLGFDLRPCIESAIMSRPLDKTSFPGD